MPKIKLKFDPTTKTLSGVPANLEALAATGEVDIWFGTELEVGAETNAPLAANRDTVLGEKDRLQVANTNLQNQYNALVGTKSTTDVEVATAKAEATSAKAEVARLQASALPAEDIAIVTEVKKVFPNMSATDLAKQIPQFRESTEKVIKMEKDLHNAKIFDALGYKNSKVFQDLTQLPDMLKGIEGDIFIEPITELGKTEPVQTAFVNVKNAQGALEKKTWKEYTETVNPSWKIHEPSLNHVEVKKEEENKTWFSQGNEKQGEGTSFLDSHITAKNEQAKNAPNPFIPKADPNKTTVNQN